MENEIEGYWWCNYDNMESFIKIVEAENGICTLDIIQLEGLNMAYKTDTMSVSAVKYLTSNSTSIDKDLFDELLKNLIMCADHMTVTKKNAVSRWKRIQSRNKK